MSFSTPLFFQPCIYHGEAEIHRRPTESRSSLHHAFAKSPLRQSSSPMPWRYSNGRSATRPKLIHPLALPNYHAPESVEDLASTLVQEIVRTNKPVPERYIQEKDILPGTDVSVMWKESLAIDLSLLSSEDKSSDLAQKELAKLRSALSEWGCLQVINHGISSSILNELHQVSKQFFALPLEEKLNYSIPNDIYNGYGNSTIIPGDKMHNDWSDRFVLTVYPEDQRKLNVWPSNLQNFGTILDEYSLHLRMIQEQVLKAMALSLGLEEDCFLNQHGKQGRIASRFAYYPPCSCATKVYGVNPHADTTTISILLLDEEVEGLEIQKGNEWFKVPIIPNALYINLGDFAEVMSNGIFKSVVHRVLTNSEKERTSVNAFFSPEDGNEIEPANELVDAQRPKLYKKVTLQTYKQLFFQAHPLGKRVIDALKI